MNKSQTLVEYEVRCRRRANAALLDARQVFKKRHTATYNAGSRNMETQIMDVFADNPVGKIMVKCYSIDRGMRNIDPCTILSVSAQPAEPELEESI